MESKVEARRPRIRDRFYDERDVDRGHGVVQRLVPVRREPKGLAEHERHIVANASLAKAPAKQREDSVGAEGSRGRLADGPWRGGRGRRRDAGPVPGGGVVGSWASAGSRRRQRRGAPASGAGRCALEPQGWQRTTATRTAHAAGSAWPAAGADPASGTAAGRLRRARWRSAAGRRTVVSAVLAVPSPERLALLDLARTDRVGAATPVMKLCHGPGPISSLRSSSFSSRRESQEKAKSSTLRLITAARPLAALRLQTRAKSQ